jgi:hypothetical protein
MLFLGLRRKLQTRTPFHEGVGPNVAEHLPAVLFDHAPHAPSRIADVLGVQLTTAQVGLVLSHELAELRTGSDAHCLRSDDPFGLALLLEDDRPKPLPRDLAIRSVEAHLHRLRGLIDRVAAAEYA